MKFGRNKVKSEFVPSSWKRNLAVCFCGSFTTTASMTLLLPFLPLYVQQLGVSDQAAIVQWSGIAYAATFVSAAMAAPFWGRLGDRYGRKLMLLRASLGMAIALPLIGVVQNIEQLIVLRLLLGFLGGYNSGSATLVAAQSPRLRSGWALGVLTSGIMAGSLAGPLIGGVLPVFVGMRMTFILAGVAVFIIFLATVLLIREERRPPKATTANQTDQQLGVLGKKPVVAMLFTGMLLMLATMSIEPIITVYVIQFVDAAHVTSVAGVVMSAAALGSIISSSYLGKLADEVGHSRVIIGCFAASALLLIPQAFVTSAWQLVVLRFLMGVALGGLLPCIATVIRHNVPDNAAGKIMGYSISAQFVGQVVGPVTGGFVAGHVGMSAVFLATAALMAGGALGNFILFRKR